MEALLEKYTDLYDFAPVGYLTLDREGIIREANLAAASLLGVARSALINGRFGHFVSAAGRPAFGAFLQQVFAEQGPAKLRRDAPGGRPPTARRWSWRPLLLSRDRRAGWR